MKNPSEEALLRTIQQGIIQERSRGLWSFACLGLKNTCSNVSPRSEKRRLFIV